MPAPKKYPDELRERATRLVVEARRDPASAVGAIRRIADQLGVHPEALRGWVKKAEIDAGDRPGTTSSDAERLAALERENRELRRANQILNFAFNVWAVFSRSAEGLAWNGHLITLRRGKSSREVQVAVVCSVGQVGGGDQGELRRLRGEVYDCFDRRADALFDLVDGICAPVTVAGVAYLSLAPGARRGHGAGYAALSAGRIDEELLRDVLAGFWPVRWGPDFAVDASVWARCDAECSPGRGFYHHPGRHSAGQPMACLPET
jgi:transposase